MPTFDFDLQLFAAEAEPVASADSTASSSGTDSAESTPAGDGILSGGQQEAVNARTSGILSSNGEESKEVSEDGEQKEQETKAESAPEEYKDFTLPEEMGGIQFDDVAVGEFKVLAKELNLTQDNAQKLVNFQAGLVAKNQDSLIKMRDEMVGGWKEETLKAVSKEDISDAVRAFNSCPPGMKNIVQEYGLENQKDFVQFLASVGKGMKEDAFVDGKQTSTTQKSAADVLFGDMIKK